MSIVYVTGKVQTIFWYISYFSTNFFGEYRKLQKKNSYQRKNESYKPPAYSANAILDYFE